MSWPIKCISLQNRLENTEAHVGNMFREVKEIGDLFSQTYSIFLTFVPCVSLLLASGGKSALHIVCILL